MEEPKQPRHSHLRRCRCLSGEARNLSGGGALRPQGLCGGQCLHGGAAQRHDRAGRSWPKAPISPTTGSPSAPAQATSSSPPTFRWPAAACETGATVIGPTGKPFTEDSIGMALATRDLLTDLRSAGATTRGPPPLSRQDISRFLSALDLAVTRLKRKLAGAVAATVLRSFPAGRAGNPACLTRHSRSDSR